MTAIPPLPPVHFRELVAVLVKIAERVEREAAFPQPDKTAERLVDPVDPVEIDPTSRTAA